MGCLGERRSTTHSCFLQDEDDDDDDVEDENPKKKAKLEPVKVKPAEGGNKESKKK